MELLQESHLLGGADAGDGVQGRLADRPLAQVAVVGDCEAMRLVAKARRHEERLRVARQEDVAAFVVRHEYLHALGEAHGRDVRDAKLGEDGAGGA